jgi:hypothetical protein
MEAVREALFTDGITAPHGAFSRDRAQRMREDIDAAFAAAIAIPDGAVPREPPPCPDAPLRA